MEKKGELTIFFGYCAGVGKTYNMLEVAHEKYLEGIDVVVGYVELHDRKDTLALMNGLDIIDYKKINYKDHIFNELDIDKALDRKPDIILVDELAHTNAPGSRHKKRYQDVEELLRAGIDVYTTLNVQHLESLHDIVESITNIKVNERIPDYVFDNADHIKIIDIEVEQLIERLKEGKIYNYSQSKKALDNFFTIDNLISLREIALRRYADKINLYTDEKNKPFLKEHILVCLGPSPTNQKVIRTAYRMANSFHAEFSALYVETSESKNFSNTEKNNLQKNIDLAKHLKANIVSSYGDDISFQISQYAKLSGVSKLVLGRSSQKISFLNKTTIIDEITKDAPNLDIFIIPDANSEYKKKNIRLDEFVHFDREDLIVTLLILLATTVLSYALFIFDFNTTNIVLLYTLSSCIVGYTTKHPIYNMLALLLNILIIDFIFIPPYYSLRIYSKEYLMIFIIMIIVSFFISLMQNRLKKENILTTQQSHSLEVLLKTSQRLQLSKNYDEVMYETCYQLHKLLNKVIIFYPVFKSSLLSPIIYNPKNVANMKEIYLQDSEKTVAKWVFLNNDSAGAGTNTLTNANGLYFAIRKNSAVFGVVGIDMSDKSIGSQLSVNDKSLLIAMLNEIALAIDSLENKSCYINLNKI